MPGHLNILPTRCAGVPVGTPAQKERNQFFALNSELTARYGRAMAAAELAVSVLFLGTVGDANACRGAAVAAILIDACAALRTLARLGAGWNL